MNKKLNRYEVRYTKRTAQATFTGTLTMTASHEGEIIEHLRNQGVTVRSIRTAK